MNQTFRNKTKRFRNINGALDQFKMIRNGSLMLYSLGFLADEVGPVPRPEESNEEEACELLGDTDDNGLNDTVTASFSLSTESGNEGTTTGVEDVDDGADHAHSFADVDDRLLKIIVHFI